jgi:hypothetical protein
MGLLTPNPAEFKFASISATKEGEENTVIAAVTGKSIVVLAYAFSSTAEGTVVLKTSSGTHASFNLAKQGGVAFAGDLECPAFKCAEGKALVLETPASTKSLGHITYVLV